MSQILWKPQEKGVSQTFVNSDGLIDSLRWGIFLDHPYGIPKRTRKIPIKRLSSQFKKIKILKAYFRKIKIHFSKFSNKNVTNSLEAPRKGSLSDFREFRRSDRLPKVRNVFGPSLRNSEKDPKNSNKRLSSLFQKLNDHLLIRHCIAWLVNIACLFD